MNGGLTMQNVYTEETERKIKLFSFAIKVYPPDFILFLLRLTVAFKAFNFV